MMLLFSARLNNISDNSHNGYIFTLDISYNILYWLLVFSNSRVS